MTIATDSKIDWDNYCMYLMIIQAFGEMLFNFFGDNNWVTTEVVVSRTVLY